jgi:hypothetical protein
MIILRQNQAQMITFVMVDSNCDEVTGLGAGFTLQVSKAGGAFAASAGTNAEISNGWYSYTTTAAETNTVGPLSFFITGAGAEQQNLLFFVREATVGCTEFTYTVTDSTTGALLQGVEVWITTDLAGTFVVWNGTTDASGVARDAGNNLPCLDAGTYYFWKNRAGYTDDNNPDTEVVT